MRNAGCRNCGGYNVEIGKKDNAGIHYECLNCNFKWFVPRLKKRLANKVRVLFLGLGLSNL